MNDIDNIIGNVCTQLGLVEIEENPMECGIYLKGDHLKSKGFFWYLPFENHFAISVCDFQLLQDCPANFPKEVLYIAIRLEYARHLQPGKVMAYMEEKGGPLKTLMHTGTRVAYTEIMYLPSFYRTHFKESFTSLPANPIEILKNMGGEHNWPSDFLYLLNDIRNMNLSGMAAELFCVGKAYELMAALVTMGQKRTPRKMVDYQHILRIIDYLDANFTKKINRQELVRMSCMSGTKFKTLFHQFTGRSITDYILEKRLDLASHMLIDTEKSIGEIAEAVGFQTATGFTTSFKKKTGLCARNYRHQMRTGKVNNLSNIEEMNFEQD